MDMKTAKAQRVFDYQKNCPQTLRAFVQIGMGIDTTGFTFDQLAEEFGIGYILHWDAILQEQMKA